MMIIKEVKTLIEFKVLMKRLEEQLPSLRWAQGQKPTGWRPADFPRKVYISNNFRELTCMR